MDFSKLTRDAAYVGKQLKRMPDKSLVALDTLKIIIPSKYIDKQMAFIEGREKYITGIFAAIAGNKYAVFMVPNMVHVNPDDIDRVVWNDVEYIVMTVDKGSDFIVTSEVVVQDTLIYYIYDTYVDGGLDAWFLNYQDRLKMFDNTDKYAAFRLGSNHAVMRLLVAKTCRVPEDRGQLFRTILNAQEKVDKLQPSIVPFKSVIFGPKTTSASLSGAYFDVGQQTRLVNPSVKSDTLERILRL